MNDIIDELRIPVSQGSPLLEKELPTLNQRGFVRAESAMGQWLLLMNEAWKKSKLPMNETVRDYLALMLDRFIVKTDIFDILIGFNYYMMVFGGAGVTRNESLRELADIALLHASIFAERTNYRHYARSHRETIELGVAMYRRLHLLNEKGDDWWARAYKEMSENFFSATMVLRHIGPMPFVDPEKIRKECENAKRLPTEEEAAQMKKAARAFQEKYIDQSANS